MKNHTQKLVITAGILMLAGSAFGQTVRSSQPTKPPAAGPELPVVQGPAPKMVLLKQGVDFGRILDDQVTPYQEVPFTNQGEGTLIIKDLRASCGCTVGELDKREYAPGESGVIKIQFKPQGKSNAIKQTVTVTTNDASLRNFEAQISVAAFVVPIVRVEPTMVNLGVLRKGEFVSNIFNVIGLAPDFDVTGIEVIGGQGLTAEVLGRERIEIDEGREGWSIEVEVLSDGSAKPGSIRGHVRVHTTDIRRESVSVTLSGQVLGDIAVSEPQIRLGSLEMGSAFERTIRVESRSGTPFKITGFEEISNLENKADWTITPVEGAKEGTAYAVTLKVEMPDRPGMVRGTTIMGTSLEDESRIQLLFFGMIRPAAIQNAPNPRPLVEPGSPKAVGSDATKTKGGDK